MTVLLEYILMTALLEYLDYSLKVIGWNVGSGADLLHSILYQELFIKHLCNSCIPKEIVSRAPIILIIV